MNWRGALSALLVAGGLASSNVTVPVAASDGPLTQSEFAVAAAFQGYVQAHGGQRILGAPVSNDFPLLGKRVQVFELQVLERRADSSIGAMRLFEEGLPLFHAAGHTFPAPDPNVAGSLPSLDSADYTDQSLAAIEAGLLDQTAPDEWNGMPVNFGATFRASVTCDDLPADAVCDAGVLSRAALDVWGLPLAGPAADPGDPTVVYLRFQRGIMQYSATDGQTQAVPLGAWFKRVLMGTELPDDLLADVAGSRFYAQYAPELPLGVARPFELQASSLVTAFGAASAQVSGPNQAQSGSAGQLVAPTVSGIGTPVAVSAQATATSAMRVPGADTGVSATSTPMPQGPDPCAGDEQLLFAPAKPYAATEVLIAATSARHHDVRAVRLAGPVKTEQPKERQGLNGWVWEWTVTLPSEGWYPWSLYVDGARLCATSGFNALPAFGTALTPTALGTATPFPTATPISTGTPTPSPTAGAAPTLSSVSPETGGCNEVVFLQGQNFGSAQTQVSGQVFLVGPGGTRTAQVLGWGAAQITFSVPTGALAAGAYNVIVQANGVASNAKSFTLRAGCS